MERHYDLVVVGAGSGDMILDAPPAGWRTAIVEPERFGGTCLNRGCIPSKMLVVAADAVTSARAAGRLGVRVTVDGVDWPAVRQRVFGRIDPQHEQSVRRRRGQGIDVYAGEAVFVGERALRVGDDRITADRMVVAVGSRPVVPDIPGLATARYHTSDDIMRVDELPARLVIVGGGYVAAEMAHVLDAFGVDVTIVHRGPRLLEREDEEISRRFTELAGRRFSLVLDSTVERVDGRSVRAGGRELTADALLICTGRTPNTDRVRARDGGLALDEHGHVAVDATYRTSVPGVWALGDAANHFQLKHMANAEARLVRHNVEHPADARPLDSPLAPRAVFTDPPIASVGVTGRDAPADSVSAVRSYADTAYGWALEDGSGFVKLIADRERRRLLGAHIIGPQAPTLIQPLVQAMTFGTPIADLAHHVRYIHPALTEVIEQALRSFDG